jgi:hypothetical protein
MYVDRKELKPSIDDQRLCSYKSSCMKSERPAVLIRQSIKKHSYEKPGNVFMMTLTGFFT